MMIRVGGKAIHPPEIKAMEIVDMDPRQLVAILNIDTETEALLMPRTAALAEDIASWSKRAGTQAGWGTVVFLVAAGLPERRAQVPR